MIAVANMHPEEPPLAPRRPTRKVQLGPIAVGGDAPITVQTMTTTPTHDIDATLQQIAECVNAGCDIVRVAVPRPEDADALGELVGKCPVPLIADIHFQPRYVFQAIEAGCAGVRVNPGNIKAFDDAVADIAAAATANGTALRIGINAGSLDARLLAKYGRATPEALVESALNEARLFEDVGFYNFGISVKHHDVVTTVQAYRQLSAACDYPLHLGVTEAGPTMQGTIKSAAAFAVLLGEGIGDTIRVSLSAPPVEEVKVGTKLLESLHLRQRTLEIISCPTCGRCQVDVFSLLDEVTEGLKDFDVPLRVAVMGCIVNGPGEAREADLGVASGNGKGQIFVRGEVVKTVAEADIVPALLEQAEIVAAELRAAGE
ncbi:MAG: flavodoxin-dependent (E)-4-hydroxy-3-methylbut-2-enyl-diphosphate synthase [Propionibacteriaceae bacterium]|jgi:(E)-4-hydroxy-3-methylbut-2-enyl-diphosphate synthase|nr:flavodoxin-dependent (E)-4-hydroxy-3-methylbut-2-enyl-diphosphate synthase [Propionibacteriaceae bacterium]